MADELNLDHGRAEGWPAIGAQLEALLIAALQGGARRIVALDPDFGHWPLSSPALLDALQAWGRGRSRRLELLAPSWTLCARRHPRLLAWRKGFDHLLDIREFDPADGVADWPAAFLAVEGGAVLRVIEFETGRAVWSHQATDRQLALESFDAIAQRSGPGWPLTTLGL
jgi:hypothetical protein